MQPDRIMGQIDRMVATGRITEKEAARLRTAEGTEDFDPAMGAIRARHAEARLNEAVAHGEMGRDEADEYRQRLRAGEHSEGLRARLRSLRAELRP